MTQPNDHEIEISLFGPGHGESIAIHLGEKKWILIDSCIDKESRNPLSLEYLRRIGVDIEKSVVMIIATHWHDDHIGGLSKIYESCKNAVFVFSNALTTDDFFKLSQIYGKKEPCQFGSGVDEFSKIFEHIFNGQSKNNFKVAGIDKTLYTSHIEIKETNYQTSIIALAPTDNALLQSQANLATLFKDSAPRKRIYSPKPNYTSVVLLIKIGQHYILLGADMESASNKFGWNEIIRKSIFLKDVSKSFQIYKIAHHGSKSSDDINIWENLLIKDPYSIMTPFSRGSINLPNDDDIDRIKSLTSNAYITKEKIKVYKWKNPVVREEFDKIIKDSRIVHSMTSQIVLRKKINDTSSDWDLSLYGDACHIG